MICYCQVTSSCLSFSILVYMCKYHLPKNHHDWWVEMNEDLNLSPRWHMLQCCYEKSHCLQLYLLKLQLLKTYCERCLKWDPVTIASISYFRDGYNDHFHGVSSRTKFRSCLARFSCCAYLGHHPSSPVAFREGGWGGFTPHSQCRRIRLLAICDEAQWKAVRLCAWLIA